MTDKEMKTTLTLSLLMLMVQHSYQKPFQEDLSASNKACLLECLTCVEFWGSIYNGNRCAQGCMITDGQSIDNDCKNGRNVGKRFTNIGENDICKHQCLRCVSKLTNAHYDDEKCLNSCGAVGGGNPDFNCDQHLPWYRNSALYGQGR